MFPLGKPYHSIPNGRSIYFQNSSLSKISNEVPSLWALVTFFDIFYKSIFTTTFPIFKNSRDRKNTPSVFFSSLKIIGILPKFYRNVYLYFISQTPLGYGHPKSPISKLGPIFTPINRFNLYGVVLISYFLSIAMHLPRIHCCYLIFHWLHCHLVIWDHMLMFLTMFLTLIRAVTIWHFIIYPLAHNFFFRNKFSGILPWPNSLLEVLLTIIYLDLHYHKLSYIILKT
jgi:hypothetical protein